MYPSPSTISGCDPLSLVDFFSFFTLFLDLRFYLSPVSRDLLFVFAPLIWKGGVLQRFCCQGLEVVKNRTRFLNGHQRGIKCLSWPLLRGSHLSIYWRSFQAFDALNLLSFILFIIPLRSIFCVYSNDVHNYFFILIKQNARQMTFLRDWYSGLKSCCC